MESQIHWVRGAAWEMHEFGVSRHSVADEAFAIGNWRTAWIHYEACHELLRLNEQYHLRKAEFFDRDWYESVLQYVSSEP